MSWVLESTCRSCASAELETILAIDAIPLSRSLSGTLRFSQVPLTLAVCHDCTLLQVLETRYAELRPLPRADSPTHLRYLANIADSMMRRTPLNRSSLVIEAGSNDGSLLSYFQQRMVRVCGVEASIELGQLALDRGIATRVGLFDERQAARFARDGQFADLFLAHDCFATQPNVNSFVSGIHAVLKPHGLAVLEIPYLSDVLDPFELDAIQHQQTRYFSLASAEHLLRKHGLHVNDVEHTTYGGGRLRLYVQRFEATQSAVFAMREAEAARKMNTVDYARAFAARAESLRVALRGLLSKLREEGYTVAASGSLDRPTFMSWCGLDHTLASYLVDSNPRYHGHTLLCCELPIYSAERLNETQPDFVLLLDMDSAADIMYQQSDYRQRGGRFIMPLPHPEIIV